MCALTIFEPGLYHFFECYNCGFIISVDQGKTILLKYEKSKFKLFFFLKI